VLSVLESLLPLLLPLLELPDFESPLPGTTPPLPDPLIPPRSRSDERPKLPSLGWLRSLLRSELLLPLLLELEPLRLSSRLSRSTIVPP